MKNSNGKKLYVQLFDHFEVRYGADGEAFSFDKHISAKFVQLMQILLLHYGEPRLKSKIVEELYGGDDIENANATLNNTIFRLRKYLDTTELPKGNYVIVKAGSVFWNTDLPVEVDAIKMDQLVAQANEVKDTAERIRLYSQACDLYAGDFLPYLGAEEWTTMASVYYQEIHFEALRNLLTELKALGKYEEILSYSSKAARIYPFEEWQLWKIDSLIELRRFKEAMEIYQATVKFYFDEFNQTPSKEMMKRFNQMSEHIHLTEDSIAVIRRGLHEDPRVTGGYFCTYPSFVDTYRAFVRIVERSGQSICLLLCTLNYGRPIDDISDQKKKETSEKFESALRKSLRRGDIFTRYNRSQYLVLLAGTNQENCSIVTNRISQCFKANGGGRVNVDYFVTSIVEYDNAGNVDLKFSESLWDTDEKH